MDARNRSLHSLRLVEMTDCNVISFLLEVMFVILQINKEYGNETDGNIQEKELEEQLDGLMAAAAFATICDVMELLDENRILVKEGLERIRKSKHPGIKALIRIRSLSECIRKTGKCHVGPSTFAGTGLWESGGFGYGAETAE